MNPWEKSSKSEPGKTASIPAPPPLPGQADESQTNRRNAEAAKLLAEANESRARQLTELEAIAAWLQRDLVAEAGRLKQLDEKLREREVQAREAGEESEKLMTQIWPDAFRAESWRAWRETLIKRAVADGSAAILLARLHTAAALERSVRPLPLELVRDLGRSVYEALPDDAERIAMALTQTSGGRFEIRTVRAGDRLDNKFMNPPSPAWPKSTPYPAGPSATPTASGNSPPK